MTGKKERSDQDYNRTIFDKKCITCGTWMQRTENLSRTGARSFTYFTRNADSLTLWTNK